MRKFKYHIEIGSVQVSEGNPEDYLKAFLVSSLEYSNLVIHSDEKSGLEIDDMFTFVGQRENCYVFELLIHEIDLYGDESWEDALASGDEISELSFALKDAFENDKVDVQVIFKEIV